jgi:hypothetical protein
MDPTGAPHLDFEMWDTTNLNRRFPIEPANSPVGRRKSLVQGLNTTEPA